MQSVSDGEASDLGALILSQRGFSLSLRARRRVIRKASGVVFIVAGMGVAAYALTGTDGPSVESVPGESKVGSHRSVHISTPVAKPRLDFAVAPETRSPRFATAELDPLAERIDTAPPLARAEAVPSPFPRRVTKKDSIPRVVVVREASRTQVGQSTALSGPPLDRTALTRELQRQLQRVACYAGSVTGVWTLSTQRAMKAFTDRVNASLPIGEPDAILLAMLQNHGSKACGPDCATGQPYRRWPLPPQRDCCPGLDEASPRNPRAHCENDSYGRLGARD